ncbi:unnamed protein product [Closterium sp. NIES-65]|nr:unnamed protein product [Closterium sp. NIES-65]
MEDVEGAAAVAVEGAGGGGGGNGVGCRADVVYVRGEGADVENVGVEETHVVGNVVGDAKEEDNAAAPTPTGVETTTGNAGVERRGGAVEAGRQPVIGHLAPGRHGSLPSDNEADKKGAKRAGGGDDALSSKRSKGADGSRGVGQVGPGGSRSKGADGSGGTSVVDQLKKNGAKVIRTHSKGDGIRSAEGGPPARPGLPLKRLDQQPRHWSPEKPASLANRTNGDRWRRQKPSRDRTGGVAGITSIPSKPPAASSAPVAPSAANNDGPSLAATPAPAGTSAAKVDRGECCG